MSEIRVALLVDAENFSSRHADLLIVEAEKLGVLRVKKAYGTIDQIRKWKIEWNFKLIGNRSGKNLADLALSLDALELALSGEIDVLMLATSDGDMANVASRLTKKKFPVIGYGEEKAPNNLRKSCRDFKVLPRKAAKRSAMPAHVQPKTVPQVQDSVHAKQKAFQARMFAYFQKQSDIDGWLPLNTLNQACAETAGITKENAGWPAYCTWATYFYQFKDVYELDLRGALPRARLIQKISLSP